MQVAIRSASDVWDLLMVLKAEIAKDRVLAVAAGVTFYALLAVVPAITALISIFGLVLSPAEVPQQLAAVTGLLPQEAALLLTVKGTMVCSDRLNCVSLSRNLSCR